MKNEKGKIVLAYSGGLDTSVILRWLIETYKYEVICFAADVGQGAELDSVRQKALDCGASKVFIEDLREPFVLDYVFPMLRANAVYESNYLLGTAIARPLIAKEQIRIANDEGAMSVSHGATGKGNDQLRFEFAYQTLAPKMKIIAPWREWDLNSRESLIQYAKRFNIPVPVTKKKPYSSDRNLFHISFEGGVLEDPWVEPSDDMFVMSSSPKDAPDRETDVVISYKDGNPVAIDGVIYSPAKLLEKLNALGGENGIGRIDIVENRFVGMKSRGVYETPGGTILHIAHHGIESITMDREVMYQRDLLVPQYAKLIYNGFWFSPERELLQTTMDHAQKGVTGRVKLRLYKGNCTVVGRESEESLYHQGFATFEKDEVFSQKDAGGFINLNALRLKINSMR